MILSELFMHFDVATNVVSLDRISDYVNGFISDAGSIYKTKIDGAKSAAIELTGLTNS